MILITFSREIIHYLYGAEFSLSVSILAFLAWIVPIRFLNNVLAVSLTATDNQKRRSTAVVVISFVNLGVNFLLIPVYGIWGAAIATVITEIVYFILLYLWISKEFPGVLRLQSFVGPVMGALCFWSVIWFFGGKASIWVQISMAVFSYGVVVGLKEMSKIKQLTRAIIRS